MQSDVPVALVAASSLQRRSPPGSRKLKFKKMPVPRSRQLALVRAHQPVLRLPSRPSRTNPRVRAKIPNRKSQMAALRLQLPFNPRPSPHLLLAPSPVLAPRVMARRPTHPTRGHQLEKNILQTRPTRTSVWDRLLHMGTNKLAGRIERVSSDRKARNRVVVVEELVKLCTIGNVVDCWVSVCCALCCSPRFAYVFAFLFLAVSGMLGMLDVSGWPRTIVYIPH